MQIGTQGQNWREQPARGGEDAVSLIAVLLLAATVRACVIWWVVRTFPRGWFFTRGTEMSFMADSLLSGYGLGSPFGGNTGPTAMFAPLYPLFVAAVFGVFGTGSTASAAALMLIHLAANLVTIALLMSVARRQFGASVALIAGGFWALSLPLWWLPTILWDTNLTICLLLGLIALALYVQRRPNIRTWIEFGAYSGLAALFNPALVLTIAGVAATTACTAAGHPEGRSRKRWLQVAAGALVFLLIYAPWPIRNERVFHAFVPLRTAVGLDVWMGNHAGATGYLQENLFPTFNPAELQAYNREGEIAYTHGKMKLAEEFIASHPLLFVQMTAARMARFWLGTGSSGGSIFFPLHGTLTFVLGACGLWLLFRRKKGLALLLAVPLLLFPLPYYVSHAEFRFRLVIDPILTLLGAYAVVELSRMQRERRLRSHS
jgi:4-amino-4-deoxy-L-arabinose transferase-like glycosyltransferase